MQYRRIGCNGSQGCIKHLAEYFEELYNVPLLTEILAGDDQRNVVALDPLIGKDIPSSQDIRYVVSELREGGASGVWGIPV